MPAVCHFLWAGVQFLDCQGECFSSREPRLAREGEVSGKCASGAGGGLGELNRLRHSATTSQEDEVKRWKSEGEDRFEPEEGCGALLATEFLLTRNRETAERRGCGAMARPRRGRA